MALPINNLKISQIRNELNEVDSNFETLFSSENIIPSAIDPVYVHDIDSNATPAEAYEKLRSKPYRIGDFRNYDPGRIYTPHFEEQAVYQNVIHSCMADDYLNEFEDKYICIGASEYYPGDIYIYIYKIMNGYPAYVDYIYITEDFEESVNYNTKLMVIDAIIFSGILYIYCQYKYEEYGYYVAKYAYNIDTGEKQREIVRKIADINDFDFHHGGSYCLTHSVYNQDYYQYDDTMRCRIFFSLTRVEDTGFAFVHHNLETLDIFQRLPSTITKQWNPETGHGNYLYTLDSDNRLSIDNKRVRPTWITNHDIVNRPYYSLNGYFKVEYIFNLNFSDRAYIDFNRDYDVLCRLEHFENVEWRNIMLEYITKNSSGSDSVISKFLFYSPVLDTLGVTSTNRVGLYLYKIRTSDSNRIDGFDLLWKSIESDGDDFFEVKVQKDYLVPGYGEMVLPKHWDGYNGLYFVRHGIDYYFQYGTMIKHTYDDEGQHIPIYRTSAFLLKRTHVNRFEKVWSDSFPNLAERTWGSSYYYLKHKMLYDSGYIYIVTEYRSNRSTKGLIYTLKLDLENNNVEKLGMF